MQQNLLVHIPSVILLILLIIPPPIIACSIAIRKGRSRFSWVMLGLLFGWIAVVIVACIADLKQQPCLYLSLKATEQLPTEKNSETDVAKYCTNCEKKVSKGFYCANCGNKID